jgi:hypothetical protein
VFDCKETELTISNKAVGKELKELYCQKEKIDQNKFRVRLLFKGQEVKDDQLLCFFNIDHNSRLQVSLCPLD